MRCAISLKNLEIMLFVGHLKGKNSYGSNDNDKKKKNHLYPQIFSVIRTPATLQGNALVSVKNKAAVTLAPFETSFRTLNRADEVGAGRFARAGAQLVVAVWRTGSSCEGREGRERARACRQLG